MIQQTEPPMIWVVVPYTLGLSLHKTNPGPNLMARYFGACLSFISYIILYSHALEPVTVRDAVSCIPISHFYLCPQKAWVKYLEPISDGNVAKFWH